jgi:hypothetical protein
MNRDFTKVLPTLWHDEDFKSLPLDIHRYLYLYYLTSPHQSSAGCYRLPDGYAVEDLGWELEKYRSARDVLSERQRISFDPATSEVLIEGWFKDNPPDNPNHRKGTERLVAKIRSPALREKSEVSLAASIKKKDKDGIGSVVHWLSCATCVRAANFYGATSQRHREDRATAHQGWRPHDPPAKNRSYGRNSNPQ